MIYLKLFEEFVEKFDNDLVDAKMTELRELVDNFSEGHNLIYEWENKDDHQVLINFTMDENSIRYEFDIDDMFISKVLNDEVVFTENVESVDEALDIIEKDIHNILGISERKKKPGRPKAEKTKSGRKVPGKYLTKNKKAMKKEIEEFQGSSRYKTKWDADYKSGKGGQGKRYKTKKSAATKAYQKMFGDKKKK